MTKSNAPLGLTRDTGNLKLDGVLRELEQYDFSPINKSCVDRYNWSMEKTSAIEIETKRFFSFAFLDQGHYHIPEEDVDEYWHRMILHTKWYQEFCLDTFGGYYHHTPEPDNDLISVENRERSMGLMVHWYGYEWSNLVETCTQCNGPTLSLAAQNLEPAESAMYK